jgi:Uma2 family endonuclease
MTYQAYDLESEIEYPSSDGEPMAESDQTRDYLVYSVEVLEIYFKQHPDVYVSGNSFIYYEKGKPKSVVSPDVYVVFGVAKRKRPSFKVWEENDKTPDWVLEVTSRSTKKQDEQDKKTLYAQLKVTEYFQYDPTGDYLNPKLKGVRLIEGEYQPIVGTNLPDGTYVLHSEVLGLDLRLFDGEMRYCIPQTGERLLTHQEENAARLAAEQARLAAEQARLAAVPRLLSMGLSVEQVAAALSLSVEEVRGLLG